MLKEDRQQGSDLYKQVEVMNQNSFSAINEKAALRDKGGVVMEKQSELQRAGTAHYEHTHKEAFLNRCTKENTGLDIKSEVAEGPIADELARLKQKH